MLTIFAGPVKLRHTVWNTPLAASGTLMCMKPWEAPAHWIDTELCKLNGGRQVLCAR